MASTNTNRSWNTVQDATDQFRATLEELLSVPQASRHQSSSINSIPEVLVSYSKALKESNNDAEADALDQVCDKITRSPSFGGLGFIADTIPSSEEYDEIIFTLEAWLESIQSQKKSRQYLSCNTKPTANAKPMTLAQKIFTQHVLGSTTASEGLAVGEVVRVGIDWVLASELSWSAMAKTHEELGTPGIWRNDRLWIAGDHLVHPTLVDHPKIKTYIDSAEKAKKDFRMTEYQGMNYTIMHTEFVRERAEPGMLVLGSDSHSCSAGAVGCLSIGLGTADVMMALSLGETWFKVPESVLIELVGEPNFAISGKDVILHILKTLKSNTVAADRIVEFAGDGVKHLSTDARFAICNMCTEFGAITGVFVPDQVTRDYIQKRRLKAYKRSSLYFQPDQDAPYSSRHQIDLSSVEPTIAVYPHPDDVVPISEKQDMPLDGVFIGACTTTEEELVLAALVLKAGLEKNLPLTKGKKHYVPGSLPIVQKLKELGLLEIYEEAGFTRGPPGCSMCVGLSAEKAAEGEQWLSSQNRNFANRMGKGSIGHITSASVCAASAFGMKLTSPVELLKDADAAFYKQYRGVLGSTSELIYVEPKPYQEEPSSRTEHRKCNSNPSPREGLAESGIIKSKIVTLGDFIDTDALAPGPTLTTCHTDEEFGQHVLEYTHPDFRGKVAAGQQVVVAGNAFGVGSSRECAVSALKGAGVKAVIARSFAFIYSRNQPSLGLLGIVITNDEFYSIAQESEDISIDLSNRTIEVGGQSFSFELSQMEHQLTINKGITKAYEIYGKSVWEQLTADTSLAKDNKEQKQSEARVDERLQW